MANVTPYMDGGSIIRVVRQLGGFLAFSGMNQDDVVTAASRVIEHLDRRSMNLDTFFLPTLQSDDSYHSIVFTIKDIPALRSNIRLERTIYYRGFGSRPRLPEKTAGPMVRREAEEAWKALCGVHTQCRLERAMERARHEIVRGRAPAQAAPADHHGGLDVTLITEIDDLVADISDQPGHPSFDLRATWAAMRCMDGAYGPVR